MSDMNLSPGLFRVSAAEIFAALRKELVPRVCRVIPPVLFVHGPSGQGDEIRVETVALDPRNRDTWRQEITWQFARSDVLWWAVCLELRLVPEPEESAAAVWGGGPAAHPRMGATPEAEPVEALAGSREGHSTESRVPTCYLVVVLASALEQQVWWGAVQRDESGRITEIETETPMPPILAREQVMGLVGRSQASLDA